MDEEAERRRIKEQLARCRRLAEQITDEVTTENLRQFVKDLEERLRTLGSGPDGT